MIERIEALMDKLLPKLAKRQTARLEATKSEIEVSQTVREHSENAVFEAYRKAGIAVAAGSSRRRIIH